MTTSQAAPPRLRAAKPQTRRERGPALAFLRHLGEMTLAMFAGMMLLGPIATRILTALGAGTAVSEPEVAAASMATTMTIGMAAWMLMRGHRTPAVAEQTRAGRFFHMLSHRWPSLLAFAFTFDSWINPGIPPAWVLVILGSEYLIIGTLRRQFGDRRILAYQAAGFAAYLVLFGIATAAGGQTATLLIAAGWIAHAGWDFVLHRANKVTWRWYAEACAVVDFVFGATILLLLWL